MNYKPLYSLSVFYEDSLVGKLALKDRRIWFQYDAAFLQKGVELSPFKLPLRPEVTPCNDRVFDGLFGLFNDSLPDGWGRLLLDRHIRNLGIPPENLTVLDRLAYVSERGIGALIYKHDHQHDRFVYEHLNLDRLAAESQAVLAGESQAVIEELMTLGGSPAGARPKILAGLNKNKTHIIHGTDNISDDYEHWIIKFGSNLDPKDNGAIEYAYSMMARAAGINIPETHLFPATKGAGYFGIKRFDRLTNKRIHVHTASGLLHADHRMPSMDYEGILKASLALTKSMPDVEAFFRLAAFNIFAKNRDDHTKNFSFLMDDDGTWHVAPAYDLTFSSGPGGEHSTTIMGEGKNPGHLHLLALGRKMNIKKAGDIIEQVYAAISRWNEFSDIAGVSKESRKLIRDNIG